MVGLLMIIVLLVGVLALWQLGIDSRDLVADDHERRPVRTAGLAGRSHMQSYYSLIAIDIANERIHQAELDRRARLSREPATGPGLARRSLAGGFALVSRGSASIARRLDVRTGEDLRQAFTATK